MEYLEGGDLHAWLEQRGPLPVDQAVEFILQASVAVAEAHGLGIVHRDLKPANLFCTRRSDGVLSVKVLDFGVSKLMERTPSSADIALTKTGVTVGTPLYMAPEQMRSSRTVDARADIWALGVILYELLGGACPFMADSVMDLSIKIYNDPPLPLRELRPEVPPALEAVILRCLEKQPAQRYPNVGELATALLPFAPARAKASVERISGIVEASGQPSAPALPSPPQRDESTGPGTLPAVGRTTPGRAPGKAWVIGAGFFAGIVVAGVAAFVLRPQGAPAHEAAVVASGPAIAVAATASASASATPVVAPDPALASASAAPPPSAAPTQRAPASAPRAAALPTARPPAVSCDPPTFTDSNGHVHLKPGCQ
jgi:serine/threonine-protein kinase